MENKTYKIRMREFRLIKPEEIKLKQIQNLAKVIKVIIERANLDVDQQRDWKTLSLAFIDIYETGLVKTIVSNLLVRDGSNVDEDIAFLDRVAEYDLTPDEVREIVEYFFNFIFPVLTSSFPFFPKLEVRNM